jgi:hypothetical protein
MAIAEREACLWCPADISLSRHYEAFAFLRGLGVRKYVSLAESQEVSSWDSVAAGPANESSGQCC